MPGRWLGGTHNRSGKSRQKWRNRGVMRSGVAERRPDSAVPEDLAGCAEAPLGANRLRLSVSLAYACCRSRESQRSFRQDVMMQHQHHKEVQLHHRQQPGGCSSA